MARKEYKPLSFTTTMRNPERIAAFINVIKDFVGEILTEQVIDKIIRKIIKEKLYKPMYINRNLELKSIYNNEDRYFSEVEITDIINNSPQNHKEAGFPKGWASRFDTWFKICKEFGFVYYEMNKKIEVSSSGYMLCDAYKEVMNEDDYAGEKIQKIFLNALIKYQTDNPFRKNLNSNSPVILILRLLKLLKKDKEENGAGIFIKEIPFITCWNDNNYKNLYNFIKNFRKKYKFKASDEIVYEECLKLLHTNNRKRFKMKQIMKEGVDDFVRKLRITGIFSLRGMGRFLDINSIEIDKIDYILKKYSNNNKFLNEYDYYKYMGEIDLSIVSIKPRNILNLEKIRKKALLNFAKKYEYKDIVYELINLQKNKPSKDNYLKLIDEPTRLEFLTSIILVKKYPNCKVKPNYAIDDEGNPTFTARGGVGDIEVYDEDLVSIVEVTLMRNKSQSINEIPAITRHLNTFQEKSEKKINFSIFIAPNIHLDTIYMCRFTKMRYKVGIYPYKINEFINQLENTNKLSELIYEV